MGGALCAHLILLVLSHLIVLPSTSLKDCSFSQRSDSNRRPAVYETAALPLSYAGVGAKFYEWAILRPVTP